MEVQQIYNNNINNILFSKNDKIKKLREKILKKLTKDYLNKKNNESIKNVDLNLLNNLDYKYQNVNVLNSFTKRLSLIIVISILFGTILAPFVLPFFGIPTTVEIKTNELPFLGLFGGGEKIEFHNVYGYLFTEENRQVLLSIVGFYFGSAVARR